MVSAGMAIVAACLPTPGPILASTTVQFMIGKLQSLISKESREKLVDRSKSRKGGVEDLFDSYINLNVPPSSHSEEMRDMRRHTT